MLPELSAPAEFVSYQHLGFENFDIAVLAIMGGRMAIAALLGAFIAYRPWRRFMNRQFERTESGAQVLIAMAGGLMVSVIGNNVALAFGLVGLGGFIRFRSGIKDPREAGVMFLMIGIGMAAGIGYMPIALVATMCGAILLTILDAFDKSSRRDSRRRIRLLGVREPRNFEPDARKALQVVAQIRGSKVSIQRDEIVIDLYGDKVDSAGMVYELLEKAGLDFSGDVSCEEI